jgi:hypothetical protein
VPQQLLAGTVEALTGEPVEGPLGFGLNIPTDFADAVQLANSGFAEVPTDLSDFAAALSGGDYGAAVGDIISIPDDGFIFPLEELLLGAAVSF